MLLYWGIGREILARQEQEGWGKNVIPRLSKDLSTEFPEMKGLSPRNLGYMRAFAEAWPDEAILQEPLAKLTWFHNLTLLEKIKTQQERQVRIAVAVNQELVRLYWGIGREIPARQEQQGWGKDVIPRLSKDLPSAFPERNGLSPK